MSDSDRMAVHLDAAARVVIDSDYSPDNKAKALRQIAELYESAGDIACMELRGGERA